MTSKDPFNFDMRVSTAKKRNPRGKRGMSGAVETSTRVCDHDGCEEGGKYRAPKMRDTSEDYFWFCKDHVREYNAKWSFFDGATEAELARQAESDERP
ncbi:MAG: molecular chaperone DnaJ, partial [Jannaschia helgolandensis]